METNSSSLARWAREGIGLFLWTFAFFYGHLVFVFLSLIPSSFRVLQSLGGFQTPVWMEVVVEASRLVLFMLIIARMERVGIRQLFEKTFWKDYNQRFTVHIKPHWPQLLIAQLVAFVLLMYALMNALFGWIVNERTVGILMERANIDGYSVETITASLLFFVKNMSNIPMSMVYVARMVGFGAGKTIPAPGARNPIDATPGSAN